MTVPFGFLQEEWSEFPLGRIPVKTIKYLNLKKKKKLLLLLFCLQNEEAAKIHASRALYYNKCTTSARLYHGGTIKRKASVGLGSDV